MAKRTLTPGGTSLNHVARHSSRRSRKMMGERTPRASMYVYIAVGLLGRDARRSIQAQWRRVGESANCLCDHDDARSTGDNHATRELLVSDVSSRCLFLWRSPKIRFSRVLVRRVLVTADPPPWDLPRVFRSPTP